MRPLASCDKNCHFTLLLTRSATNYCQPDRGPPSNFVIKLGRQRVKELGYILAVSLQGGPAKVGPIYIFDGNI